MIPPARMLHFLYFVLNSDRQILYDRIDRRVDSMMEEGLEMEVARLKAAGYTKDMVSMQGLGYKEVYGRLYIRLSYRRNSHCAM